MTIDLTQLLAASNPTICSVPDCGKETHMKGFCKEHHRDRWCPTNEGNHEPIPWSISPCDNGQVMAKCMHCSSAYLFTPLA